MNLTAPKPPKPRRSFIVFPYSCQHDYFDIHPPITVSGPQGFRANNAERLVHLYLSCHKVPLILLTCTGSCIKLGCCVATNTEDQKMIFLFDPCDPVSVRRTNKLLLVILLSLYQYVAKMFECLSADASCKLTQICFANWLGCIKTTWRNSIHDLLPSHSHLAEKLQTNLTYKNPPMSPIFAWQRPFKWPSRSAKAWQTNVEAPIKWPALLCLTGFRLMTDPLAYLLVEVIK